MSSVYQRKSSEPERKAQEEEHLDNAKYHTEFETVKDDAERASELHKERTGKELDISDKNVLESDFPEKKSP
ncbi:hypothetical protein K450DRAFT_245390 [Umbelopsis ramanniana AG]|uniref:Uncharacterized protein n=1 Tax=Umbelopsis ramanniana AG TaxID=1314678 RepID=A0AAD5E9E9_UMBRA|nr:uncharacterized protein K450DRAFT_245390 [Umbelopsis ramanniana AG]KAI8578765.1 hypothetical protein K450DRAFT_245390 [Umbelopsis ramanniana AG]